MLRASGPVRDSLDDSFHGGDETVAASGQRLDEAGAAGGVAESLADAIDGGVDTVFIVDEVPSGQSSREISSRVSRSPGRSRSMRGPEKAGR